jgi:hypothetical protein
MCMSMSDDEFARREKSWRRTKGTVEAKRGEEGGEEREEGATTRGGCTFVAVAVAVALRRSRLGTDENELCPSATLVATTIAENRRRRRRSRSPSRRPSSQSPCDPRAGGVDHRERGPMPFW